MTPQEVWHIGNRVVAGKMGKVSKEDRVGHKCRIQKNSDWPPYNKNEGETVIDWLEQQEG